MAGCCLLFAIQAMGTNLFGMPQEPQADQSPRSSQQKDDGTKPGNEAVAQVVVSNGDADAEQFSETTLGLSLLKNIVRDQKTMWTSPARIRYEDMNWLVPVAGITTASLFADTGLSQALKPSSSAVTKSNTFSNYGLAAFGGLSGGMYLWGTMMHDDHQRETGLLSGEAGLDAVGITSVLQYAFGRQRPTDGNGGGGFWQHGTSFPSDHSTAAWAVASVIAHEYPGTLTKLLVYGLASAVSLSRVTGQDHFPTDVLIGAGIGWFAGRHVFLAHHDPELGGGGWGLPFEDDVEARKRGLPDKSAASTFVPLDSWVYPAFERLAAMGYATTAIQGLKPWTRIECARLTEEVGDALVENAHTTGGTEEQAIQVDETLKREFAQEIAVLNGGRNRSLSIDSVYTRVTSISGPILTDALHLGGQTISYDFGRPFERGTNAIVGTSVRATEGPFAVYARVEYQHSPSAPSLPENVLQFISTNDQVPLEAAQPIPSVNRADLLEGYVSFSHSGWQVSAGKQAMSLGDRRGRVR